MLTSQVNYWTLEENKRSHLANEAIAWYQSQEAQRHNLATELISEHTLQENARHNVQSEKLGFKTLEESRRHNVRTEDISYGNYLLGRDTLRETVRANKKREAQNKRSLDQQLKERKIRERTLAESIRHNLAYENIQRSNVSLGYAQLGETNRSNLAKEFLTDFSNTTQRYSWAESIRHNKQSEDIQKTQNWNTSRDVSTREKTLDWNIEKYKDYEYPLDKRSTNSQAFRNVTSGIRDITGAASDVSSEIRSWIGKTGKKK